MRPDRGGKKKPDRTDPPERSDQPDLTDLPEATPAPAGPRLPEGFAVALEGWFGPEKAAYALEGYYLPYRGSVRQHPARLTDLSDLGPWEGISWSPLGRRLTGERPAYGQDPRWHAGGYYVQEASSQSVGTIAGALIGRLGLSVKVALDMCAAPGGKTTHLTAVLPETALLVANEVIAARGRILEGNLERWGAPGTITLRADADEIARRMPGAFDLVVVDAPCSGEGLFRREALAADQWSMDAVGMCARRQQGLLEAAVACLRPGGLLIYSTCTLNPLECEGQAGHEALARLGCTPEPLPEGLLDPASTPGVEIPEGEHSGHARRFWPGHSGGEGFFVACARRKGLALIAPPGGGTRISRLAPLAARQATAISPWLAEGGKGLRLFAHGGRARALPEACLIAAERIVGLLPALQAGTAVVALKPNGQPDAVPEQALATSQIRSEEWPAWELSLEQAKAYLQRAPVEPLEGAPIPQPGQLILLTYQGLGLGWGKWVAPGRLNNYLPPGRRLMA